MSYRIWGVAAGLVMVVVVWVSAARLRHDPPWPPSMSVARPSPDDPLRIRQLQERQARVFVDEHGRVVRVLWNHAPVVDDDLKLLHGLNELHSVSCRAADKYGPGITDAGLKHLIAIPKLRWLNLSHNSGITNAGMKSLGQLTQLEFLDLLWARITNDSLAELWPLTRLRYLKLPFVTWKLVNGQRVTTETGCTAEGLTHLWGLPLEELDGIDVDGKDVCFLRGLRNLRRWRGMSPYIQDSDLDNVPRRAELTYLCISLSEGWGNTSQLRVLDQFPQVQSVMLEGAPGSEAVDGTGLPVLASLPTLTKLRLTNIPDEGVLKLPALSQLEVLDLSQSKLRGEGLAALTRFPKLTTLTLNRETVNERALEHFPNLPMLPELRLGGDEMRLSAHELTDSAKVGDSRLSDATLVKVLSQVPELRQLSLAGLPLSDNSLKQLRLVPQLQTLDLSGTTITDDGLIHLQLAPHLQEITVRQVPVTDRIFTVLHTLPQLRALHHSQTGITFEGADAFYRKHPDCYLEDPWNPDWSSFGSYQKQP